MIELPLPDFQEVSDFLTREVANLSKTGVTLDQDPGVQAQLTKALQGLTINESRHALRRAVAAKPQLDSASVPYLLEEKHLLVKKKTGVIEYIPNPIGLEEVGGAPVPGRSIRIRASRHS